MLPFRCCTPQHRRPGFASRAPIQLEGGLLLLYDRLSGTGPNILLSHCAWQPLPSSPREDFVTSPGKIRTSRTFLLDTELGIADTFPRRSCGHACGVTLCGQSR